MSLSDCGPRSERAHLNFSNRIRRCFKKPMEEYGIINSTTEALGVLSDIEWEISKLRARLEQEQKEQEQKEKEQEGNIRINNKRIER